MSTERLDQIMSKVLTLSKCFKSSSVFDTTFCFADAEHLVLLLLIIASNISTSQFNQTNKVIYRQKLGN